MAEAKEVEMCPDGKGDGKNNKPKRTNTQTQTHKEMTDKETKRSRPGDEDDPAFVDTRRGGATHQSRSSAVAAPKTGVH